MLWIAAHFRDLRRQASARGNASVDPEGEALQAAALALGRFTPRICLDPPSALALEVSGSLRLFGGEAALRERIQETLSGIGLRARLATAPTAQAALWQAATGALGLEAVPVRALGLDVEAARLAQRLGVRTLGELLRLPREGLARRFGVELLRCLDRALGRLPEQRAFFVPPARFSATLRLPAPTEEAERTLFALRRLLLEMEGFLVVRQAGTRGVRVRFVHEGRAPTTLSQSFAAPLRAASAIASLLRERLRDFPLPAPVTAVRLADGGIEPFLSEQGDLFRDPSSGREPWAMLVDRLRARLGEAAVYGLALHADHRPEKGWRPVSVPLDAAKPVRPRNGRGASEGTATDPLPGPSQGPRPFWLLERPRPVAEGGFVLLGGPERIESGWWDGGEVRRDYFVARLPNGALAWLYRDERGWFVHGLFA